jgi:hypothetical protein
VRSLQLIEVVAIIEVPDQDKARIDRGKGTDKDLLSLAEMMLATEHTMGLPSKHHRSPLLMRSSKGCTLHHQSHQAGDAWPSVNAFGSPSRRHSEALRPYESGMALIEEL